MRALSICRRDNTRRMASPRLWVATRGHQISQYGSFTLRALVTYYAHFVIGREAPSVTHHLRQRI